MAEDNNKEDDFLSDLEKSTKNIIPKINAFGMDIKLDTLGWLGVGIATAAALGTGYLLYDQYKNKMEYEKAMNQWKQNQANLANYQRQQQYYQPPTTAAQSHPSVKEDLQQEEEGMLDMGEYKPATVEERKPASYEQILNRANSYLASPVENQTKKYEESPIDMDNLTPTNYTPPSEMPAPATPPRKSEQLMYEPIGSYDDIYS